MIDVIIAALENNQVDEAVCMLKRLRANTRGHERLGQNDMVVITHPSKMSPHVLETVSHYAVAFGGGDRSARNLRLCGLLAGGDALRVIPQWFKRSAGWIGRDEFSLLLYETMIEADLVGEDINQLPLPYPDEEGVLRERLLFSGVITSIDAPLPPNHEELLKAPISTHQGTH